MEHLNRELKSDVSALGTGKTEQAIVCLGKAIGTVEPVLRQFDKINGIQEHNTRHKRTSTKTELIKVVNAILNNELLSEKTTRKYTSFPNPHSLLHKQTESELIKWIKSHIPTSVQS
jgi:hypothetical protein